MIQYRPGVYCGMRRVFVRAQEIANKFPINYCIFRKSVIYYIRKYIYGG